MENMTQRGNTESGNYIRAESFMKQPKTRHKDTTARLALLLPAIVIILFLSIFPLIVSLYLSFARVSFVRGGVNIIFVGFNNYQKLLFGSGQRHLIGALGDLSIIGWLICLSATGFMIYWLYSYVTSRRRRIFGTVF